MKKKFTGIVLALVTLVTTSAFVANYQSTGYPGFTGSPGESSCSYCHGGGSSAVSGTTISAVPSFTDNEYVPGTNYTITVTLAASGFNLYGFGCEILNDGEANAGNMHNQGAGVKFLTVIGRKNAVQSTPKSGTGGASFTFEWTAPDADTGDNATIYVAGNAVNGNNNFTGDFPMPPVSLALTPKAPDIDPTGIRENTANALTQLLVYPNPATALTNVSYYLTTTQPVHVELVSLSGALVKDFFNKSQTPGPHSQILDLQGVSAGVYFVKVSVNGEKSGQKLISVQ